MKRYTIHDDSGSDEAWLFAARLIDDERDRFDSLPAGRKNGALFTCNGLGWEIPILLYRTESGGRCAYIGKKTYLND